MQCRRAWTLFPADIELAWQQGFASLHTSVLKSDAEMKPCGSFPLLQGKHRQFYSHSQKNPSPSTSLALCVLCSMQCRRAWTLFPADIELWMLPLFLSCLHKEEQQPLLCFPWITGCWEPKGSFGGGGGGQEDPFPQQSCRPGSLASSSLHGYQRPKKEREKYPTFPDTGCPREFLRKVFKGIFMDDPGESGPKRAESLGWVCSCSAPAGTSQLQGWRMGEERVRTHPPTAEEKCWQSKSCHRKKRLSWLFIFLHMGVL
uniref:uncharacterized protein n=1 Tax=Lonchura striata TaxID=40157 RepID=UPI0012934A4A|nr:uncharacterized protein LOC116184176 [Lonchura striata domestica]